jgi:predicted phage terminase large subunit-like protein
MLDCLDAFYGGSAGGGKSIALLTASLLYVHEQKYNAILIRDTMKNLSMPDSIMDVSHQWLSGTDAHWSGDKNRWNFPSGATLSFGYLDDPRSHFNFQSSQFQYVGIDEAVNIRENQAKYMFSRLRKLKDSTIPIRFRCASNPPAGEQIARGQWVKKRYVDPETRQKGVIFIPAKMEDNQHLNINEYKLSLQQLDIITRKQLEEGDWEIKQLGNIFKREWFELVNEAPIEAKRLRYWDLAATEPTKSNKEPAYTSGAKLVVDKNNIIYIESIIRFRKEPRYTEQIIRQTADMDGRNVIIYMEQEPGSPIWEEENVLMKNGIYKKLKDIKENDYVITKDGISSKVVKIYKQGELDIINIKTESGREIKTAYSHLFYTPYGWKEARELEIGDILGLRVPLEKFGSIRKNEEFRLAGYFIGDGCCTKAKNSINARFTCTDNDQGKDFVNCVESLGYRCNKRNKDINSCYYNASGGIRKWLYDIDLAEKRTENKVVPKWVYEGNNVQVSNFIGAYFACDGSISKSNKGINIEFYSISKELLQGIQNLLLRFGINSRLRKRKYHKDYQEKRKYMYRLTLKKGDDSQGLFAENIIVYGKKRDLLKEIKRQDFNKNIISDKIIYIEKEEEKKLCRCIKVEQGESFLVNDIIVHNSGKNTIDHYRRNILPEFAFYPDKVSGSKFQRATPFSSQAEAGNVKVVKGHWNEEFFNELELFPDGKFFDQIDSCSGAFNVLWTPKSPRIRVL